MNYVHVAYCQIAEGQSEPLMQALLANAEASRSTEPGCLCFDVAVDPASPHSIMLYEVFQDLAAFEAHQRTEHHRRYVAEGVPMLVARVRHFFHRLQPSAA